MHALLFARVTKITLSSVEVHGPTNQVQQLHVIMAMKLSKIHIVGISGLKLEEKAMFSNYAQDWH